MVAIRKTKAKEEFGPDPSLDLPQGAHLKVTSSKLFAPKFHEETGDLWKSKVSLKRKVVDDRTEDGDADGLEFFDRLSRRLRRIAKHSVPRSRSPIGGSRPRGQRMIGRPGVP